MVLLALTELNIKISVITATWNCAATIGDCLASVSSQTYLPREHVVIDGASQDGTLELLRAHQHGLSVLISEPDNGIYDALNKGLQRASGDIVGFLHADDIFATSDVLERVAELFRADSSLAAVYGDLQYVRQADTTAVVRHWVSSPYSARRLAWGWMPPHPTLYVRKLWYEQIGGFDTRYRIAADYHSIIKLFSAPGFKAVYLPQVLVKMRMGGASNRSWGALLTKSREDWDVLRRTNVGALGGLGALFWKNFSKLRQF